MRFLFYKLLITNKVLIFVDLKVIKSNRVEYSKVEVTALSLLWIVIKILRIFFFGQLNCRCELMLKINF